MDYIINNFDKFIKEHDPKKILLVQPAFPIPNKIKHHKQYYPIGLLKIASYLETKNIKTELVICGKQDHHQKRIKEYNPDMIFITSLFTYWSKSVKKAVQYFKHQHPQAIIVVGGIYASLLPEHTKKYTGTNYVYTGLIREAEKCTPKFDLYPTDFQILHTTRGCIRRCGFCGTYKIEPEYTYKKSIKDEIKKKKLIFYDNNLLANPYIKNILHELIQLKKEKKINYIECQSGFDGRILDQELAILLKKAGFKEPKIAWDGKYNEHEKIKHQLNLLVNAGYKPNNIGVFMVYNYNISYPEMEKKRTFIYNYGSLIMDCRFRPLNQTYDEYNPRKKYQTQNDYYIHPDWTDQEVKQFRRNVRQSNICNLFNKKYYCKELINKSLPKHKIKQYNNYTYEQLIKEGLTVFNPAITHTIGGT